MADLRQQQNAQQTGKKKKNSKGGLITFIVLILWAVVPRLVRAMDSEDVSRAFRRLTLRLRFWAYDLGIDPDLMPALVSAVFILVVVLLIVAAARRASVRVRENNTSAGRTSAATQRRDPRTQSFTAPAPSCIVCDHTGEDHFVRDKAQRIAQLDEWLKNGLIDREEYRVMKDRYERDL